MPNPVDVGTGTTVTFGTSGFSAFVTAYNGPNFIRDEADTTHMATTGGKTNIPGDLYDIGEMSMDIYYDPSLTIPMFAANAPETITLTFPIPSGLSTGATVSFSGWMKSHSAAVALEDTMKASVVIRGTGNVTITPAA